MSAAAAAAGGGGAAAAGCGVVTDAVDHSSQDDFH